MNEKQRQTAAERYDRALHRSSKRSPVPAGCPVPKPTAVWPPENIALLEKYRAWLEEGDVARSVIQQHRIPMAGHVLGLHLKPHSQLDLDSDLQQAMDYVEAKQLSTFWTNNCRHSLRWFCRFLSLERGILPSRTKNAYGNIEQYKKGLPEWLLTQLEQYLHLRQANWRPARMAIITYQYWYKHTRLWRWLFAHYPITTVADVKRHHLFTYMDEMLTVGYAPRSVNIDLYTFQATLQFLQGRGIPVPQALLNVAGLKVPDSLPRFLTDAQTGHLRHDLEQRVKTARTAAQRRNAFLDRAAFYLLWQAGLRVGELEELSLADLNLGKQRLMIRRGKGLKDRITYLTTSTITAVKAFLTVRGTGRSDHLFLYRRRPLCKDLIRDRMKAAGKRTGIKVTPHMLRHTFATQLLNAGCKVTTIQALLGHKRLNSTMIYARVHDQTVADDYYAAISVIEEQMNLQPAVETNPEPEIEVHNKNNNPADLLTLTAALQTEPLTASQQAVINQLQCGLLALAESMNETPIQIDQIVNEQVTPLPKPISYP